MLCAFDFDGTLAPIEVDPGLVYMPAAVARRLDILSSYASIAVVTGRAVADVQARLGFAPSYVVGNHGLEGVPGCVFDAHFPLLCAEWEKSLHAMLQRHGLASSGVRIENKGCSLSVHYRLARDREYVESQLATLIERLTPAPHLVGGKCVFNLLTAAGMDKGAAVNRLMEDCGAAGALYVGDDVTDEDVFRLRRRDLVTVRVEPATGTCADFFLHHRLGMVQLLDELISRLRRHS